MDKNEEKHSVYAKLRDLRRARGLTVDSLAKKVGENSQKVGRIERGGRSLTVDYLVKVAKALETPMSSILNTVSNDTESAPPSGREILNNVIVAVEEFCKSSMNLDSQKKANMISKFYEIIQKLPIECHKMFLSSLFESIKFVEEIKKS